VVVDHQRSGGRKIFEVQIGNLDGPAEFAGVLVQRNQVIVGCLEPVTVDARTAVADVNAALAIPLVVPDLAARSSINCPSVLGTPKSMLRKFEQQLLDESWKEVHAGLEVKLCPGPEGQEVFILAAVPSDA
jgi:hypothetical protein